MSTATPIRRSKSTLWILAVVVLMASACSTSDRSPTQYVEASQNTTDLNLGPLAGATLPDGALRSGFYPLTLGNSWTYRGSVDMRIKGDSVSMVDLYAEHRELTEFEVLFGREYTVETQKRWSAILPFPPSDSNTSWIRFRQDKAGLYDADYPESIPPGPYPSANSPIWAGHGTDGISSEWTHRQQRFSAELAATGKDAYQAALARLVSKARFAQVAVRAVSMKKVPGSMGGPPGGVLSDELLRLKYPMRPEQHWTIRETPLFEATVDGFYRLKLPAGRIHGYAIRIESPLFGERDRVEAWYGRDGFLGMRAYLESVATDELGNPIGVLISSEQMLLEDYDLTRHSP